MSPEEEREVREKVRRELEQAETERLRQSQLQEQEEREKQLEEDRQRIILEEQEKFYKERGLQKYVNHFGKVEWLTPEQIEAREKKTVRRKKSRSKHSRRHSSLKRRVLDMILLGLVILVGLAVTLYLTRGFQPRSGSHGSLWVCSDVKGAAIYIDGELSGSVTDGVIGKIKEGEYTVSVTKPGYLALPPQIRVKVVRDETVKLEFKLKKVDQDLRNTE